MSGAEAGVEIETVRLIAERSDPEVNWKQLSTSAPAPGKFRGKRRIFEKAMRDAKVRSSELQPEAGDWWDHHHWHVDWAGRGNISPKIRRRYFEALLVYFRRIASLREEFETPFQTWISLSGHDAGQDAVYLHTPNGNGTSFPTELSRSPTWTNGGELREPPLMELAPEFEWRVGWMRVPGLEEDQAGTRTSAILYARDIGVSLE